MTDQLTPSAFAASSPYGLRADSDFSLVTGGQEPAVFEVHNNDIRIFGAQKYLQELLDFHSRYPTAAAIAQQDGWKPPEAELGEFFWDGYVHMIKFPSSGPGHAPSGLLDLCVWVCERYGFPFVVDDERVRPDDQLPDLFEPVVDRDYQIAAADIAVQEGRGVLDMPPRSGKTRTMVEIHRRLALPMIWIAPSKNICAQTKKTVEGFFGPNHCDVIVGTKNWEKFAHLKVVIATAATARALPPEFWATREMFAIDEFHHAAATTYHEIAAKAPHIYYRYGMTGTFFRSGDDAIAMHSILSKTIYKIGTPELLERGYLVPTSVVYLPVAGRIKSKGTTFQTGAGRHGIYEHPGRTELAVWATETLVHYGRRVLVLVGTKVQGRAILESLSPTLGVNSGSKFGAVEFVSTDRPANLCQEVIDAFVESDGIKVLIGTSMVGEGTDLPSTDACVYCPGQKAEVPLVQAAYRVCTKMAGKTNSIFVDFADRHHKTLLKHSLERLRVFYNEPTFEVEVLDDPTKFTEWVSIRAP